MPSPHDLTETPNPLPTLGWWFPGVFFLLVTVLGTVMALLSPATWRWPREGSFWQGDQASSYESTFNENLPLRNLAVDTWGVLEYALFHEGRPGVVVGTNDWLFTQEEVAFYPDAEVERARKLAYIREVRDVLRARGITLVVALVPDKSRVYAEFVGRTLPGYTRDRYAAFQHALREADVLAPDLLAAFEGAKTERQLYLRTDTHWTPAGAALAARLLAETVRRDVPEGRLNGLFETRYQTAVTGLEAYRGDLLAFLPLGALQDRLGPKPDQLETRQTTPEGGNGVASSLFGTQTIPVTLIGTSYSADERWNFTGALQEALGADVLNLATEGRGPLPPMRDYLESPELRDTPPTLVVWEIPERYMPVEEEK